MTWLWRRQKFSRALFHNSSQYTPTITEWTQVALAEDTQVFKAGNLDNFEVSFMYMQVDHCLNFKAIAINLQVVQAIFPKGVIPVAQVTEACSEQDVDEPAQAIVPQETQVSNIVTASPFYEA
jgi:hypothetical protein